jgi:hypothetical protein
MSETNELRIAVIGAGPAGVYSSDIFLRQLGKLGEELGLGTKARIDLFEKLPVPFGLVRYGVARPPFHQIHRIRSREDARQPRHPPVLRRGIRQGRDA